MQWPKIETGIPIPPKRKYVRDAKHTTGWATFVCKLNMGDSFVSSRATLQTLALQKGIRLVMRHNGNNRYRYWRIA